MEKKIIEKIAQVLEIDVDSINMNTKIVDIEQWDSFAHVQIVAELESEMNIDVPIEEISNIEQVSDFLKYVK